MMKIKFKLLTTFSLLLFLTIFSCSSDSEPVERTDQDIENDFKAFEVKAGKQDLTLKISDEISYNFRVIFPAVDLTTDWPLILTLHGASGGDPDAHKYTECYVEPGLADLDAIIISPNGGEFNWETLANQDKIRILLTLSIRHWPVDVSKMVVTGYSNGGNGSWFYAETQPGFFSAAIPMAAGYSILNQDGTARKIDIPLYVIHGENDDLFPLATVQNWAEQTQLAGTDIEFVVAEGLGHYTPCEYVSYFQDAATWLETVVWQ